MAPRKTAAAQAAAVEHVQPVLNLGLVGHVDHGKTTLTQALSGRWTDTHSEEIKRGITIRLGYANFWIRSYTGEHKKKVFTTLEQAPDGKPTHPERLISLVDAPGHESLMATMLAGSTIMDGALLLIAANEECPQPQTREHLMALQIIGIKKIVIVQNKVDLVSKEAALKNYNQIKAFLKGTEYEHAPIVPVSAQHRINISYLLEAIEGTFPTPAHDLDADPLVYVARSFDINKPGTPPQKIIGGVFGGAVRRGRLRKGDMIEIRPGYEVEEKNQKVWKPLTTKVRGFMSGNTPLDEVRPGGSIAILTGLDPSIVKSDKLTGALVGIPGKLPPVWYTLKLEIHLLERVVGAREDLIVEPIKMAEILMLNVNSAATVGVVTQLEKNHAYCKLKIPVCAEEGSRVTISRRLGNRFRLIGYGVIKKS